MKGRTTCPKCKYELVMDLPDDIEQHTVECPSCHHFFVIKKTCNDDEEEECGWEEHGEPRKTILSSLKKKTNKPIIASFLLLTVGVLGIFTAVIFSSSTESLIPEFEFIISYLAGFNIDSIILLVLLVVFSIFSLLGSISAYLRRYYMFTAICAVIGIFSIGLFIGLVLAIIALGLLIISRDEFEHATKGKVF